MPDQEKAPNIAGIWTGTTYGTHPATVMADIKKDGEKYKIDFRANISGSVATFEGEGAVEVGSTVELIEKVPAKIPKKAEGQEPARLSITFRTVSISQIEGTWATPVGAAGVLNLGLYSFAAVPPGPGSGRRPAQVETREVELRPVRMGRSDVEALIQEVEKLLPNNAGIIVTVGRHDKKTTNFAPDFLDRNDLPLEATDLLIGAVQNDGGAQKQITITLGILTNQLRVSWTELQWVIGAAQILEDFLEQRSNGLMHFWRKHSGNMNLYATFALVVFLPDLSLIERAVFTVAAIVLMWVHRNAILWITRTVITLRADQPAHLIRDTIFAVATSAIGGALAIMLYGLIKWLGWPLTQ